MKTVNLTEEEHAELLKLRAIKTAKASASNAADVVRAAGTSEGVAKSWEKRHSLPHEGADIHFIEHADKGEWAWSAFKDGREFATDSGHKSKESAEFHAKKVVSEKVNASEAVTSLDLEVIHCRSNASAAGSVLAASRESIKAGEVVKCTSGIPLIW